VIVASFTVSWNASPVVENVDGYRVYRRDRHEAEAMIYEGVDTAHVDSTVENGRRYYYTVESYRGGEVSVRSRVVSGARVDFAEGRATDTVNTWKGAGGCDLTVVLAPPLPGALTLGNYTDDERVSYSCEFDVTGDGVLDLSDFSFFGEWYVEHGDLSMLSKFGEYYNGQISFTKGVE